MTEHGDYVTIIPEHLAFAAALGKTIMVERQPSEAEALFIDSGHFKVITSNGESFCEGPVWILWDSGGYPYPITPTEFERIYKRKE